MTEMELIIRKALTEGEYPAMSPYVEYFRGQFPNGLLGIIFYGSMLFDSTATQTSFPDFFLLVDDYSNFYSKRFHRFLNRHLPPNIFYLCGRGGESGETTLKCKYNVVSLSHLERETGIHARDLYLLGRFTKRIALLYAQDETVPDRLACVVSNALRCLAPHASSKMHSDGDVREFGKILLRLSYEGEVRVEKNLEKVDQLYNASRDYYETVFNLLWKEYAGRQRIEKRTAYSMDKMKRLPFQETAVIGRLSTEDLIRRSRRRAVARWPKGILLTDNWVDILLDKVERTHGVKIELTPLERRFALILGWKHFFRLRREGKIK